MGASPFETHICSILVQRQDIAINWAGKLHHGKKSGVGATL